MADLQLLRSALGVPAYEDDDILLYQGDALSLLDSMPANTIELTVTSPPYNIGKVYEVVRKIEEYVEWTAQWTAKVHRVTAENGAFWLNLGYVPLSGRGKAVPISYLVWDRILDDLDKIIRGERKALH